MTVTPTPAKPSASAATAPVAPPAKAHAPAAPPAPVVAKSATTDLEALVNRAYNRPTTQEERAFLAATRARLEAGVELSEFDARWLAELAGR